MKLKFFGYFIFIATCIVFSLYTRFPGKVAANHIEKSFSQINSQLKLQIDNVNLCFPPGIKAESILINYDGAPIAKLDNFKTFFNLSTFFSNVVTGSFKVGIFDGIMSGMMHVSKKKPRDFGIETDFETLDLKNIHLGKSLSDCEFSGILNGKITAEFKEDRILKNYGEIKFADLALQFPQTLFSVETYTFSSGKLKFVMPKQNIIKIEEFTMKGRQTDIQASGEIRLAGRFQQSRLKLKARVVLYPMFFMDAGDSMPVDVSKSDSDNATINLRIRGTIQNPIITMDKRAK